MMQRNLGSSLRAGLALACLVALPVLFGCSRQAGNGVPAESTSMISADDGTQLFVRILGSGADTVLVAADFLMEPHLRDLARERTLVFWDMRNRGASDSVPSTREVSIQADVRDLESVRSTLGVQKFDLVGYSYLGLMVALYAMDHPERVRRLVQIGPVPMNFSAQYPPGLRADDYLESMDAAGVDELRKLQADGFPERSPAEYCEREWRVTRMALVGDSSKADRLGPGPCRFSNEWPARLAEHYGRHFASVRAVALPRERFASIAVPTLVIHGTRDRNAPYGSGREWAMTLPDARLLTVPGAAHAVHAEASEIVLPALRAFLGGGWPDSVEQVTQLVPAQGS